MVGEKKKLSEVFEDETKLHVEDKFHATSWLPWWLNDSPAGPNWFTKTPWSHSPVVYDPFKPQIQIQLFFLALKLLGSKVKEGKLSSERV